MSALFELAKTMFSGCDVVEDDIGIHVDFGEDCPTITAEQVSSLTLAAETGDLLFAFEDRSRRYESCTIYAYTLVIARAPACAAGSERGE